MVEFFHFDAELGWNFSTYVGSRGGKIPLFGVLRWKKSTSMLNNGGKNPPSGVIKVEKIHPMTSKKWKKSTMKRQKVEKIHRMALLRWKKSTVKRQKETGFWRTMVEKIHPNAVIRWKNSTFMQPGGGKNPLRLRHRVEKFHFLGESTGKIELKKHKKLENSWLVTSKKWKNY